MFAKTDIFFRKNAYGGIIIMDGNTKRAFIWSRATPGIRTLIEKAATVKGLTLSEYIRTLVTSDLAKREYLGETI